jgi:phosphate butyryltransferase
MITSFNQIITEVQTGARRMIAVAGADDEHVLQAVIQAGEKGIADAVLVGNGSRIESALRKCCAETGKFRIEHVEGELTEVAEKTVSLVTDGTADAVMKGRMDTSILLKAVLNEKSLRTERFMGVLGIIEPASYGKLIFLTDGGFIIRPTLEQKIDLIRNGVELVRKLGIQVPKVGVVCAIEKVNEKMPDTLEAAELVRMNREGAISGCIVEGPFGFDNAVSAEAAARKGVQGEVPGDADILVFPDLVSANAVYKAMGFLAGVKTAGYLAGANVPIILSSRADSADTKLNSIAIAALAVGANRQE